MATDGSDVTQGELLDQTADLMGAKRPGVCRAQWRD